MVYILQKDFQIPQKKLHPGQFVEFEFFRPLCKGTLDHSWKIFHALFE